MLQQIIKDMYIDPDLLAELSEEQKQLIYLKIREEQVRRWKEVEDKVDKQKIPMQTKKSGGQCKTVNWLLGKDSKPWVWVMGDHPDDLSIEEIIEREAQQKANKRAEKEAEMLRQKEELEIQKRLLEEQSRLEEEKKRREEKLEALRKQEEAEKEKALLRESEETKRKIEALKEKSEKARLTREESYRHLKQQRTTEILNDFHKTRALWERKASEDNEQLTKAWKQQEVKAKQADVTRRNLAKSAREDYKKATVYRDKRTPIANREAFRESAVLLGTALTFVSSSKKTKRAARPVNRQEVKAWFLEEEKPKKAGMTKSGSIENWFHGVISREDAEVLLDQKPVHSFLVRLSEKIWGYAISYKAEDRCKHYLVDINENGYQFFGTNQLEHSTLSQLIMYHKNHPVSTAGQELLVYPVTQTRTPPDYAELFPEICESTSL